MRLPEAAGAKLAAMSRDQAPPAALTLHPIGTVRSPHRVHHQAPRQPGAGDGAAGEIRLRSGLQNLLADLAGFSHIWVVFWCHLARGWNARVAPPRGGPKRGVLATRAPHRPNPIGLSCVRLHEVRGTTVHIGDHDLLDGTPVLDLKPYVPYCDAVPDASSGWIEQLGPDPGPDHRAWWRDKNLPLPDALRRGGFEDD